MISQDHSTRRSNENENEIENEIYAGGYWSAGEHIIDNWTMMEDDDDDDGWIQE